MEDSSRLAQIANNKKIWINLRDVFPHPYTEEDAVSFISMVSGQVPVITFGIEYEQQLCGVVGLRLQEDVYRESAELGFWVAEEYWGKGLASEAVRVAVEYAFEKLDLIRIFSTVFQNNSVSMRILEKNGFELEGIGKKAIIKNGIIRDEYRYALLSDGKG